jgi:hypothetical protein
MFLWANRANGLVKAGIRTKPIRSDTIRFALQTFCSLPLPDRKSGWAVLFLGIMRCGSGAMLD